MTRSFNGRMRDPHSRDAGSSPARVTDSNDRDTAKWWNWDTRDAQNVVPLVAWEFESPLGNWIENETIAGEPALSRAS